ncbi:MAG: hypothetical protein JWO72_1925, partial [Caulobacteraceae bacterium]|nr:hypothetical protein [Caulobacteraceae bacterium]
MRAGVQSRLRGLASCALALALLAGPAPLSAQTPPADPTG